MKLFGFVEKGKNKFFIYELVGIIFGIVGSFIFHFAFEWIGEIKLLAWLFPVNESVWEHVKILLIPYAIFSIIEYCLLKPENSKNYWGIKALSMLLIPLAMIVGFYTYTGIIGTHFLALDILLSVIVVFLSYYLSYTLLSKNYVLKNPDYLIVGAVILLYLIVYFTYFPPKIDLFLDSTTAGYGLS